MATARDGWTPYESGGAEEKSRPFQPEIDEETEKVSEAARQNNSTRVSVEGGNSTSISSATSELERVWKLKNFTRSESKHPTTMENLPNELLINIFIRLLAKQLAQMRSVSKSWNTLLSHPSFVKSHLHHSINNSDRILLVFHDNASCIGPEPYSAHPSRFPYPELTNFIKLPPVNPESGHNPKMLRVIGSVHVLICSRYGDRTIHIWNPSLSAVSTVPPHSMPSCDGYFSFFRFGYDPKTDDYKIVKLTGFNGTSPLVATEWLQVEVYGMRNGSWKFITQSFPSHLKWILNSECICVDGHDGRLHWPGCVSEINNFDTIVAFDLSSETFSLTSLTDSILSYTRPKHLGVLRGKLCVYTVVPTDGVCEVWVMDKYGVAESWIKHVFSQFVGHAFSLGFTSTNEFLIVDDFYSLVLYDPTAREAKTLENFCHNVFGISRIAEYVDSLVWVEPAEREMVNGAGQN